MAHAFARQADLGAMVGAVRSTESKLPPSGRHCDPTLAKVMREAEYARALGSTKSALADQPPRRDPTPFASLDVPVRQHPAVTFK